MEVEHVFGCCVVGWGGDARRAYYRPPILLESDASASRQDDGNKGKQKNKLKGKRDVRASQSSVGICLRFFFLLHIFCRRI